MGRIEDPTVLAIIVYAKWTEGAPSENPPSGNLPSENPPSGDLPTKECKHNNTKKVELSVGDNCNHSYLVICSDCGVVVDVETVVIHTWSEEPKYFVRESCLVGAHTAICCLVCGVKNENTIVYSAEEDGECYAEHLDVVEVTYYVDESGSLGTNLCTSDLKIAKVCLTCGEEFEVIKVVEAPGHVFGDWKIELSPTADMLGKIRRSCTVCGKVQDKEIPSLYVTDIEGNATAEVNAFYVLKHCEGYSCSVEGRVDEYSFVAPDGNTIAIKLTVKNSPHYIVVDNRKLAIQEGDVVEYIEGEFTVLNDEKVTCASFGTDATFKCAECGQIYSVKVRKPHAAYDPNYGEKIDIVAATCTEPGRYNYNCSICNQTVEVMMPALGHKFVLDETKGDGGMSITRGDHGEAIYKIYIKCDDCDESALVVTERLTVLEDPATCTEPATIIYTDIVFDSGYVFIDSEGKPVEIRQTHGTPLGHAEGVVENGRYNIADLTAENVRLINGNDFNCVYHDGSAEDKWKEAAYRCPDCDAWISIKVYKSHEANTDSAIWKDDKMPTCTESAVKILTCKVCMETLEMAYAPLGHDWVYTLDAEYRKIADFKCLNEGCSGGDEGSIAVGTEVENVILPTCESYGSAVVIVDGCERKIIIEKSAYHTFNGMVMNGTADNPVRYMEGMRSLAGGVISCVAPKTQNVFFTCDCCGEVYSTYAIKDHNLRTVIETEATCTTSGRAHADCYVCAAEFVNIEIPALGHNVEWTIESISGTRVSVDMSCSRCDFEENCEFDLSDCFDSNRGKVIVDDSRLSEQGFEVETITPGTCSHTGVYRLTCRAIEKYSDCGIVFDTPLTFDITYRATHESDDADYITWHTKDGKFYRGRYCRVCGMVIPEL